MELNDKFRYFHEAWEIASKIKSRTERLSKLESLGYKVRYGAYMRNASKLGEIEYFSRKKEYRMSVARPSEHYVRQFDVIVLKMK